MKILKNVERGLFLFAVVVVAAALSLSLLLDEGAKTPIPGVATSILAFFTLGAGFVLLLLLVGAVLKFCKGETPSRVGESLVLTAVVVVFVIALVLLVESIKSDATPLSAIIGLVGGIAYICYVLVKAVIVIIGLVKPEAAVDSPSTDSKIQAVLQWKELMDQNIISKEEFEKKRVSILGLDKPEKK